MFSNTTPGRLTSVLVAIASFCLASTGLADDTDLFTTGATPNVMLQVDNSGSMAHVVWHESYDPAATPSCTDYDNNATYFVRDDYGDPSSLADTTFKPKNYTRCGQTRLIYSDENIEPDATRWSGRYLNWYFSLDDSDPDDQAIIDAIEDPDDGLLSACLGGGKFAKYMRSRATAAQQILREVICQVNEAGAVRFGMAQFRKGGDPTGGFVRVPLDDYTTAQADTLEAAIQSLSPDTWTPLGETLFQIYTYFMSRDSADIPTGKDDTTKFPAYSYATSTAYPGGPFSATLAPGDPLSGLPCQKNFIVIITDGEPTKDDFDNTGTMAEGFGDFHALIGDYNDDSENEEPGGSEMALYLDDIALYMQTHDFRPDIDGMQTIDVYTVGFTTSPVANDLLQKTADVGNGLFFFSNNAEELTAAIVGAISDILQKAQSFTSPTVPASRSAEGNNFYTTYFQPQAVPFWTGHLASYDFTLAGEILDSAGDCALVGDPDPCVSGPIDTAAPPFWDAQDKLPLAASRTLYFSQEGAMTSGSKPVLYTTSAIDKDDYKKDGIKLDEKAYKPVGSLGGNENEIADQITEFVRGCKFGSIPCENRNQRLGDLFHSTPLIVGPPNGAVNEASYLQFASDNATRTKMLYVGSNGGFLHGFIGEVWDTTLSPPKYNRLHATAGTEQMGFMPYPVRDTIKYLPLPGADKYYGVDASPQAADVWFPPTALAVRDPGNYSAASQWHTVLVGGLRQGGRGYFALDVTKPDVASEYPLYLWEFPCEDGGSCDDFEDFHGQSWSEPVITRVRVSVNGDDNGGKGYERWVAIFGAGYDPQSDPNNRDGNPDYDDGVTYGRAVFMVDVTNGQVLAAETYDSNASKGQPDMLYGMPSNPAVIDIDFDGFADVVYIGDLGGQVWKWAIHSVGEYKTDGSHNVRQPNWKFRKFLSAPTHTDGGETYYKSFFYPPTAALHKGKLYLAMATGERNDLQFQGLSGSTGEDNRIYVVKDADPYEVLTTNTTIAGSSPTLDDLTNDASGNCSSMTSNIGFFIRTQNAEKFTAKPTIFLGTVFATSYLPYDTTADPCLAGGLSFVRAFDMYCGGTAMEQPEDVPDEYDDRVIHTSVGLPSAPKITVGDPNPDPDDPDPPCSNLVVVTSSDGSTFGGCAGNTTSRPVTHESWRQR